ncbi:hypothetical protein, partial [Pseudomonas sp. SWRI 103]|uniref:hypothetical protein n=1 Tax=Pseudomonas sp. SWRI 103 TaxID=2725411 RepID=UPI001C498D44
CLYWGGFATQRGTSPLTTGRFSAFESCVDTRAATAVGQITNLYQTVRHRRQASFHRNQYWILELRLAHL